MYLKLIVNEIGRYIVVINISKHTTIIICIINIKCKGTRLKSLILIVLSLFYFNLHKLIKFLMCVHVIFKTKPYY